VQKLKTTVIPAQAGIQCGRDIGVVSLDSGLRRNDGKVWMSGEL